MKISDIFYSLQGEGHHAGKAAIFIRFYGCNLDCSFCDEPLHKTTWRDLGAEDILEEIMGFPSKFIVLTGGEPSLNDLKPFITLLRENGYYIAIETNGYKPANIDNADWITYSPKDLKQINMTPFFQELKIVINSSSNAKKLLEIANQTEQSIYIQPEANFDQVCPVNTEFCVELIKENPRFQLSLQTHKMIAIP